MRTTITSMDSISNNTISVEISKRALEDSEIVSKLIDNMISLLKELEKKYPKNIRFLEEE